MTRSYAWPLTVQAGEDLRLHVSTEHRRFGVRLFRVGAAIEAVTGPDQVYDGHNLPLGRPDEAWGWPAYSVPLEEHLRDGIYWPCRHRPPTTASTPFPPVPAW